MALELQLREVLSSDVAIFFTQQQDKNQQWQAAFVAVDPSDRLAHNEHWEKILANPEIVTRTIELAGVVLGYIGSYPIDGTDQVTYWLPPEFSGSGFASRALASFLKIQSQRPLEARTAFDNYPSARVLEKNGFRKVGQDIYFSNARDADITEFIWVLD